MINFKIIILTHQPCFMIHYELHQRLFLRCLSFLWKASPAQTGFSAAFLSSPGLQAIAFALNLIWTEADQTFLWLVCHDSIAGGADAIFQRDTVHEWHLKCGWLLVTILKRFSGSWNFPVHSICFDRLSDWNLIVILVQFGLVFNAHSILLDFHCPFRFHLLYSWTLPDSLYHFCHSEFSM